MLSRISILSNVKYQLFSFLYFCKCDIKRYFCNIKVTLNITQHESLQFKRNNEISSHDEKV